MRVAGIQRELTELRVRIEAWLDFPDEELPFDAGAMLARQIDALWKVSRRLRPPRSTARYCGTDSRS